MNTPRIFAFLESRSTTLLKGVTSLKEEQGHALVEMALCISLFGMPLLFGTVEMGSLFYTSIEVSNGANAGAMYGMISSTFAANSSGIVSAARSEAVDLGTSMNVTPTVFYACSESIGGTQYSTQSSANSACSGGSNHSLEFIQVITTATITPPIRCPGLPATFTLTGTSVMEVQE